MTKDLPNYTALEPPDEKPIEEYTHHERRAALLRRIRNVGSPFAITQAREAERFGVHRSTITRDMNRLRESIGAHLGDDAKLTTRVLFESTINELLEADDWRATKAAWDIVMDWNEWLADLGEQDRAPDRSELDVDVDAASRELAYTVVTRDGEELLRSERGGTDRDEVDPEEIGFTSGPTAIDVETHRAEDGIER